MNAVLHHIMIRITFYRIHVFGFLLFAVVSMMTTCYCAYFYVTPALANARSGLYNTVSFESSTNSTLEVETNQSIGITSDSKNSDSNLTLQYEFPEIGLKIKYPANWEKIEYGRAVKAYGEGLIANFHSPVEGQSDKFREFVQLRVENLPPDNLGETSADSNYIGNNPILQTVFDRPNLANKSVSLTTLKEWSPLNDKALVIEFSALKSEFAKLLPLALEIMNSIEINGVGVSSPSDSTNQSSQLMSNESPTQDKPALASSNNTQTASVIERLMERGIDINETHAD